MASMLDATAQQPDTSHFEPVVPVSDTATLQEAVPEEQATFEEMMVIDGLVIDETVTKVGRDFYELYFRDWEPPANISGYTIFIAEKPARARATIIAISINDEPVYSATLQPRYDYLVTLAEQAQIACGNYLRHLAENRQRLSSEDQLGNGIF